MISRTKSPVISLQKSGRSAKNNIFVKGVVGLEIFLLIFDTYQEIITHAYFVL